MSRLRVAVLNLAALCVLLAGMSLLSDDVRRHLMTVMSGDRAGELAMIAEPADRAARMVLDTLAAYQSSHGHLVAFGVVAFVLVGFMLKL